MKDMNGTKQLSIHKYATFEASDYSIKIRLNDIKRFKGNHFKHKISRNNAWVFRTTDHKEAEHAVQSCQKKQIMQKINNTLPAQKAALKS